jgi:hypothetical protein
MIPLNYSFTLQVILVNSDNYEAGKIKKERSGCILTNYLV